MKHSRGVYRKQKSSRYQSKRSGFGGKNILSKYKKIFGTILVLTIFIWGIAQLFSKEKPELVAATITAESGSTEFSIDGSGQWTFLQDSVDLFSGDSLKTLGNGNASIELLGGNTIFIKENSEIKITQLEKYASKKQATIEIIQGEIWANIGEVNENDSFKITTPKQTTALTSGVLAILIDQNTEEVSAMKGTLQTTINQAQKNSTVTIEAGNKLIIDQENQEVISSETLEEFLTEIPNEFLQSEWHIKNLAKFFPNEALSIQQKITEENTPKDETTTEENPNIASPTITSPASNINIPAETTSIKIEGIAPENTNQISINGYTLTKFQPGDRKWSYFASTKFGTMIPGENTYSVIAITRDGKQSAPAKININYQGSAIIAKPVVIAPVQASFASPLVTSPQGLSSTAPWETSSSIITIKGNVPAETNKVTVNEFALRQFRLGSGEFSYIANAQYGNFVKGENLYVIKAFGPDGKSSETALNIIYTPVSL